MPISTAYAPITYAGDSIANAFAVTFPYQLQGDLVVSTVVVATGVTTLLVLGTDYIVTPTLNSPADTGTVTTTGSIAVGTDLVMARSTPVTQLTTWVPNDPNLSTSTMNAVDKLTMEVQEIVQSGGSLPDSALGAGTATTDTFLRGGSPRQWTNTLIGPIGPFTVPADTTALHIVGQSGDAGYKIVSGATSVGSYRFGVDGSSNPWDFEIFYDPTTPGLGFQTYGNTPFATFDNSGNVGFTGTVNATLFTGNADGSLITSGQVLPQFLASNASGNASTFLNGLGLFAVPAGGGGGINTTTTAPFTIPAVNSSNTVNVTDATGIVNGTYLQISDGTHTINGLVTNVASLALTVKTQNIILGISGNTMASGAAVQGAQAQIGTITISDVDNVAVSMTNLQFDGSATAHATSAGGVFLYIKDITGTDITAHGYVVKGAVSSTAIANAFTGAGVTGIPTRLAANGDIILPTAQGQVLSCSSFSGGLSQTVGWGLIGPSNITSGSLTPVLLNATNSLTNGDVPSYDSGTGRFTWVANGGSIPGGGNAGLFFRGDNTFSNILDLSHDSGAESIGLTLSQGVTNGSFGSTFGTASDGTYSFWIMQKRAAGTWGTPASVYCNYQVGTGIDGGVLSVGAAWTNPDGTNIERIFADKMIRTSQGLRSVYGPLSLIYEISAPASPLTIDLVNGAYQRISSLGLALTIALADTTPLPTSLRYESELTLELNLSSHDITWPGTITWANGVTGPTIANGGLNATGINIVRLIRRQGQTQWVGVVENPLVAGSGTVTSVATGTGLTGGPITTTGTISIPNLGITKALINLSAVGNAQFDGTDPLQASKIQNYSTHSGDSTYFLNNAGNWTQPSGGGGGGISPNNPNTWTATQTYTSGGHIVSSATNTFNAKNTFNGPQVFASNGFGGTVGSLATGEVSFSNYFPNDNLSVTPLAAQARITLTNSYTAPTVNQEVLALDVLQVNNSLSGGVGQGCAKFENQVLQNVTSQFSIALQELAAFRQVNGGSADGVWFNSWSPCAQFSATPDATGVIHSFGGGVVRIGEVNYGNAWADLGFIDDRGLGSYVAGIEFFPDWLAGNTGATSFTKFHASWAIAIGAAGGAPVAGPACNWTGILISKNGITPGGIGVNVHGGDISTTTTGTFTIAAVGASQTVAVSSTSNINISPTGYESNIQVTDGTHTILGHVTGISSLNLTVVTDTVIAGSAGNTMATSAIVSSGPGVGVNFQNAMTTGINFAGSAGGSPTAGGGGTAATFTSTGAAAITLADDQSIKFGSIWLRGHSSTLQYSTNGTSWSTLTLP